METTGLRRELAVNLVRMSFPVKGTDENWAGKPNDSC
jgi:hypothetical protein